jgi:SAM-dependent methyltransferase
MQEIHQLIDRYYSDVLIGQSALEAEITAAFARGQTDALDAGCGIDAPLTRKFGDQAWIVGIDACRGLPQGIRFVTGDLSKLPFAEDTFSLIFSRSVFEHLPQPEIVLKEFQRVLRPDGRCIILTPNKFDYSSLVAAVTPQWFHEWFVRKIYGAPAAYDTFPTFYRANTPGFFRSLAKNTHGWRIRRISGVRHYPANLTFSKLLFRLGIFYDWIIARMKLVSLQPSLLVVIQKTQAPVHSEATYAGRQEASAYR